MSMRNRLKKMRRSGKVITQQQSIDDLEHLAMALVEMFGVKRLQRNLGYAQEKMRGVRPGRLTRLWRWVRR